MTDRHTIRLCCLSLKPLKHWTDLLTTWVTRVILVTATHFLYVDQFGLFWLGDVSVRKSYSLSQGSDVSYIGHWPRAICHCDRKTDILTDRQADRHICRARASRTHITVCRWTVSKLPMNCLKNVCFQCLTSRKWTIANISRYTPIYFMRVW